MTPIAIIVALVAALWLAIWADDTDDDYLVANPWKETL